MKSFENDLKEYVFVNLFGTHASNEILREEGKINIFAFSIQDFKEPCYTTVCLYLASNVLKERTNRQECSLELSYLTVSAKKVKLNDENNSNGHLLNKNK